MMPRQAELLAVGSELLEPWRLDTNGSFLSRRLGERGYEVRFRTVVGDRLDDISEAFTVALGRANLIIATGGLGPTVDDVTREAVASLLGLPLIEDGDIMRGIEARFRQHGLTMPPQNRRQALVPKGAEVLPNRYGTAPGLLLRAGDAVIGLLPGVPAEMQQIADEWLLPALGSPEGRFVRRILKIAGVTESEVDRRLLEVERRRGPVGWTILANPGLVEIHLKEWVRPGQEPAELDRIDREIAKEIGQSLFARGDATLEQVVGELLRAAGQNLAVAESITGGAVARLITSVPGASSYFLGGIVCYQDDAKVALLGVRPGTLAATTAVSPETALEMAEGVRQRLGADWGLATTGYAGPTGGGEERPAGTVVLALCGPEGSRTRLLSLPGGRSAVRERTALAALDLLRRALLGEKG